MIDRYTHPAVAGRFDVAPGHAAPITLAGGAARWELLVP